MTTQQNERVELPPLPEGKAVVRGPVSAFNDPESGTLVDFDCEGPLSYDPDDGEELFTADQMREYARAALLAADAQAGGEAMAWLYTLEYGNTIADTKVSIHQLNYPFGVVGADYLRENQQGVSYVRETKLYKRVKK